MPISSTAPSTAGSSGGSPIRPRACDGFSAGAGTTSRCARGSAARWASSSSVGTTPRPGPPRRASARARWRRSWRRWRRSAPRPPAATRMTGLRARSRRSGGSPRRSGGARPCAARIPTASRPRLPVLPVPDTGSGAAGRAGRRRPHCASDAMRCGRGSRPSCGTPRPTSPRGCAMRCGRSSQPTRRSRRAPAASISSPPCRARDLVRDDPAVRRELRARFTHLFVDEFQDTDPLQVELLLLLAADDPEERDWRRVRPVPGKLFLVGDPKQSIYRFRRADVDLYRAVCRQLLAAGARRVELTVSFRAVPELQEAVNAAFGPPMADGAPSQAGYVPLRPWRSAAAGQPALVALPVPAPYGPYGRITDRAIEASLPDAVGAFVEWLVGASGWTVTERERPEGRVPIAPRHVCLLFRRFRSGRLDVTRPYLRALESRRVPHVLVGGAAFHAREEIEALRNVLRAIERPEDELMVFATLRGPLFAFDDGTLLAFRTEVGSLYPFRRLPDDLPAPLRAVGEALGLLAELHRGRNHRPFADTIARLLDATRAHAGFAIWPTGEQALANVSRLLDLARRAERRGTTSFRAFVEWLIEEAERNEASEAPMVEESVEGVRLMTVHRAKGLEFPVVILADPTAREVPREPARWVDAARGLCALRLAGLTPPDLRAHAARSSPTSA